MTSPTPVAQAYNAPVNFFISQQPPTGISDPPAAEAIAELYNAAQNIIQALVNYCGIGPQSQSLWSQLAASPSTLLAGNLNRFYVTASENIQFGAMINLFGNSGVVNARNANATDNTKPADGFCSTSGGIAAAGVGEVQLGHGLNLFNGLTPGTRYFLDTSPGLVTATKPTAVGNIEQYVGIAIDANDLFVNLGYWIQH